MVAVNMTVWRYLCWEDSMFSSIFSGSSASSVSGFMLLTREKSLFQGATLGGVTAKRQA